MQKEREYTVEGEMERLMTIFKGIDDPNLHPNIKKKV